MALLPLCFHKSALKLNIPVFHSVAKISLIRTEPCASSTVEPRTIVFPENKGKDSPAMSDEYYR